MHMSAHGILRAYEEALAMRPLQLEGAELASFLAAQISERLGDNGDARAMKIAELMIQRGYPMPNERDEYFGWLEMELRRE